MSATTDFRPGLEGVVAVETEIAEPDREGGQLRYRGIDIEELVGAHPYEYVWGLLVDNDLSSKMPDPEPYEPAGLTGNAPADLQAETARLAGEWKLGKLNEISDEQAREDLGRLSAQMMEIVARAAAVADGREAAPDDVVEKGKTAAEKFLLRWRGEADPKHVKAIDTYWICTAEHGLNASTFTARIVASTGADCGAALSSAVGALSGPLHGGAPAYVKPMLEEVAALGRRGALGERGAPRAASASWASVTASIAPRTRARGCSSERRRSSAQRTSTSPKSSRQLRSRALQERHPDRVLATNVEYYSAVVLDAAEIPPPLAPAMFACSRVAGWSAHILEQKRTGRLFRPSARYVGPGSRSLASA